MAVAADSQVLRRRPRSKDRRGGPGGMELVDDAMATIRAASPGTLALYYVGAVPFILSFLYFWAEMSQSPFAGAHIAGSALSSAVFFLWMKFWQALFARNIRATIAGNPPPAWTLSQHARVFLLQVAVQPSGLFLIPLALTLGFPFGWVYAFYQNATVLSDAETTPVKLVGTASKQMRLWPMQNHVALAVVFGFGLFVMVNWMTVALLLPTLLKSLLGIETVFSTSPLAMLNTTFLAMISALTYLCMDPIVKTLYALRCFHGEAIETGADIQANLKEVARSGAAHVVAVLVLVCACGGALSSVQAATGAGRLKEMSRSLRTELPAFSRRGGCARKIDAASRPQWAQTGRLSSSPQICSEVIQPPRPRQIGTGPLSSWRGHPALERRGVPFGGFATSLGVMVETGPGAIPAGDLDREIDRVLQGRKYVWRIPRERAQQDEEQGVIAKFIQQVFDAIREPLGKAIRWIVEWLFPSDRGAGGTAWGLGMLLSSQFLLYLLIAAALILGAVLLLRMHWRRSRGSVAAAVAASPVRPDIAAESTGAEDLPEDEWTKLGRELMERGELRLAMRAFYFASLVHLAGKGLIAIARFKSNREYENEVRRRGHSIPGLAETFGENRLALERVWYGLHETNGDLVNAFLANVSRIKTTV